MMYFIDHNKKSIHLQKFAGDRCGFIGTPVKKREFTNCPIYVVRQIKEKEYNRCSQCATVQVTLLS
ncbi:hypothetical protein [Planococcus sp. YIM B11945]|uniref:hypothetical protein n=1 Tax=Planococcus sp. YIM B11945 TaxID=3435410 RepID=UPI003D7DBBD2